MPTTPDPKKDTPVTNGDKNQGGETIKAPASTPSTTTPADSLLPTTSVKVEELGKK
jgi:hypothetical protein